MIFTLRDESGRPVVVPDSEIQRNTQVFEKGRGTEDWQEIDYTETSFFVDTAEAIPIELAFVLDFTNSMASARLPDGRDGIQAMLDAFEVSVLPLGGAHLLGAVEFHDRNMEPAVLSELSADRQALMASVNGFHRSDFDPGSTRVWDAVTIGSGLFTSYLDDPNTVRALVFLSDGRDTSSINLREDALAAARERDVRLYALGVGDVFQEDKLRQMAESSGGGYYAARELSQLQEQLQLIINNLRGQYRMSYITLRRTGEYENRIAVNLGNASGSTEVGPFNVADFFGFDNQGVIDFDTPSIDREKEQATVFVRSNHMPRNINRIRFKPHTDKPVRIDLVAQQDGGLLDGWAVSGPDAGGFYDMSSHRPLDFGSLGLLFRMTISGFTERGMDVPVEFDNSIYSQGKRLNSPEYVAIGPNPPPSGRITFRSNRDGDSEIYAMNADGTGAVNLSNNPGSDNTPAWSPDGSQIAFRSDRDGNLEIYVMDADGSNVRRLTNEPAWDTLPGLVPRRPAGDVPVPARRRFCHIRHAPPPVRNGRG